MSSCGCSKGDLPFLSCVPACVSLSGRHSHLTACLVLQTDANSQCANVQPHGGKMQACLQEHRALLTWDCQEQLFRQEVENSDDLRLSVRLFKTCLADKKKVGGPFPPPQHPSPGPTHRTI